MSNSIEVSQIAESLEVQYTAFCNRCGTTKTSYYDEDLFAKDLHKNGWRVTDDGDLHCPSCHKQLSK